MGFQEIVTCVICLVSKLVFNNKVMFHLSTEVSKHNTHTWALENWNISVELE